MSDELLRARVRSALAARDRGAPAPAFDATWRAATRSAQARPVLPRPVVEWFENAAAIAAIAAIAIAAVWNFGGPWSGETPWAAASDLQLARELAPSRQWPRTTDGLLHAYDYTPSPIDVPRIENPFEETFL